jgi:hypothetical protein
MEAIRRSIEQLRELALGEPSAFARCLERLLATDFDATFYCLKTQKLLFKSRSSLWISTVERELHSCLERAPLKGKQRARIKRHLIVCKSLQQLFEIVDEQSSTLRIWQASTEDLLRSLFASAEKLRFAQKADSKNQKSEFSDQLNTMKHLELVRMKHRTHCDYVTRIVGQIAHLGINLGGEIKPTPSDIQDALGLAALDDMLLHILDCYTYRNFRVSVEGKHLKMHGVQSQTEASYTWSVLRHSSREVVDHHQVAEIVKKVEALAENLNAEFDCFSSFLESGQGIDLLHASQPIQKEYARILRRDVSELIDLKMTLRTSSGLFRVEELLECWALLTNPPQPIPRFHVEKKLDLVEPCAAGSRAAAPGKPGLPTRAVFACWGRSPVLACSGRNAAEREQKFCAEPHGCLPAASFALSSLNSASFRIRSNAASSRALAFVIPFSSAFFSSWIAGFFSPSWACDVATR